MQSIHDRVVEKLSNHPIPDNPIPIPDLIDVYLRYCRYFYGDRAREVAIEIVKAQKDVGLKEYGALLTADTKIDAKREGLVEIGDAICYFDLAPIPDWAHSAVEQEEVEVDDSINFALSFAIDVIQSLPVKTKRSQVAQEVLTHLLEKLTSSAILASGFEFEDDLHA